MATNSAREEMASPTVPAVGGVLETALYVDDVAPTSV